MKTSSNYGLKLMEGTDNVKRQDFVDNFTKIDTEMKNIENKTNLYGVASGTNTYTVSITGVTSYHDGLKVTVKIGTASTGASTLNINGLGAKTILDNLGNAITSGGLKAGIPYNLCYNGTNFIVLGKGGGGNATADKILNGYTATVDSGQVAGTMANNGAISGSLNAGQSKVIPKGYTDGGTITANSLASQTQANATVAQILAGYSAWVNGVLLNGGMVNRGAVSATLNAGGSYTIPQGYHNGSGKITANSLASQGAINIKKGTFNVDLNSTQYNRLTFSITGIGFTPKIVIVMAYSPSNKRSIFITFLNAGTDYFNLLYLHSFTDAANPTYNGLGMYHDSTRGSGYTMDYHRTIGVFGNGTFSVDSLWGTGSNSEKGVWTVNYLAIN